MASSRCSVALLITCKACLLGADTTDSVLISAGLHRPDRQIERRTDRKIVKAKQNTEALVVVPTTSRSCLLVGHTSNPY